MRRYKRKNEIKNEIKVGDICYLETPYKETSVKILVKILKHFIEKKKYEVVVVAGDNTCLFVSGDELLYEIHDDD